VSVDTSNNNINLLQMEKFVACGRNFGNDLSRLESLGVVVPNCLELRQIAITHDPDQRTGLEDLVKKYCNVKLLNKDLGQNADYEFDQLPRVLIEYGAFDALYSRLVAI